MSLLHLSINASEPGRVASFLAAVLGGRAMPFPPFPQCWIAFAAQDDGMAIEVYPNSYVLLEGEDHVEYDVRERDNAATFVHAAIATRLPKQEIASLAHQEKWTARECDRGPFSCVEVWIENRLLIEVLDPGINSITGLVWPYRIGLPCSISNDRGGVEQRRQALGMRMAASACPFPKPLLCAQARFAQNRRPGSTVPARTPNGQLPADLCFCI